MQNSASYSIVDVSIITLICQKSLQIHRKEEKINDHSYSMFSKSQNEIFVVQKSKLQNLQKQDKARN